MPAGPSVGEVAPDFTLPGTGGIEYTLSDHRGQVVVLVFYPGDNTPVCTVQLTAYSRDIGQFSNLDAVVLAVSPQDVDSHEAFSADHGFTFPLLADVDKAVAKAYNVVGPIGFYRRSVFVLDRDGVIRYAHRSVAGTTYRPVSELLSAVKSAARVDRH